MGYVHDVNMFRFVPPEIAQYSAGAWTDNNGSDVWKKQKAAAAESFTIKVPINIPGNSAASRGCYLKSIQVWYRIATAACTAFSCAIKKVTMPANGASVGSGVAQSFTYDTDHDAEAERYAIASHTMTLTITTPFWIDSDENVYLEIAVTSGATTVFNYYGIMVSYTLRV